jgi:hypothetical protein
MLAMTMAVGYHICQERVVERRESGKVNQESVPIVWVMLRISMIVMPPGADLEGRGESCTVRGECCT